MITILSMWVWLVHFEFDCRVIWPVLWGKAWSQHLVDLSSWADPIPHRGFSNLLHGGQEFGYQLLGSSRGGRLGLSSSTDVFLLAQHPCPQLPWQLTIQRPSVTPSPENYCLCVSPVGEGDPYSTLEYWKEIRDYNLTQKIKQKNFIKQLFPNLPYINLLFVLSSR